MNLKQKLQIFITVLIFFSILLSGLGIGLVVYNNVLSSEESLLRKDLERSQEFFKIEANNLSINVQDWSVWDDTYKFMQDSNQNFINANLSTSSISSIQITSMIFLNLDGSVNHAAFSNTDNTSHQVELGIISSQFNQILNQNNEESKSNNGIIKIRENTYLFGINGITNSDGTSPINGYLLMLRLIDEEYLQRLTSLIDHEVKLENISLEELTSTESIVLNESKLTDENVTGYVVINDSFNKPILKTTITHDRFLFEQAKSIVPITLALLSLVAVISGSTYYWFMQKDIVENLNGITKYIQTIIAKEPITQAHPKLTGEFAKVASVLTQMSNDLMRNERDLETKNLMLLNANKALEAKQAELAKSNADLQEMNSSMVGRETKMIELKREIEQLKAQLGQS